MSTCFTRADDRGAAGFRRSRITGCNNFQGSPLRRTSTRRFFITTSSSSCEVKKFRMDVSNKASRDILSNVRLTALLFWLPIIALIVSGFFQIVQGWRTALWVVALSVMGASCVVNAFRCGRVHCYTTGPFFLLMAVVALLYGLGVIPLGTNGWNFIGAAAVVGAAVLMYLPEALLGRYRRTG
jgi:phosphoglycerol transferase MdoB-like AlkP superfamily enzyme